ncbi:alpha/beta fold hydrolase [Egicoccus halophilus]|uniref:Alpha/beta fold hydrolase n=1 Tax=Egicoccus halophilus TaxID=1670830 RepID=A0A8J3AAM2_9ACTN|nr:alpha/beta fold hydrolase [Egicoccus halophilus]GGI08721.1 hypothetical protein GCM10011354_30510 [Egicoccus halophilus]
MSDTTVPVEVEHLDVVIVGAGISGIGAAYYLQRDHPHRRYAVLEARDAIGGTWDLFRYPGIRSDSDLHTFGYEFRPWSDREAIASGDAILRYLRDTAAEYGIDRAVRHRRRLRRAVWSGDDARWHLEVEHTDTGEVSHLTCSWLFSATGYYRYDAGHTPEFPGRDRFRGEFVHPQHWPDDLDTAGKRVVVIGSGATAVTLVPALAGTAASVTMLQRTPTYVLPLPTHDAVADALRRWFGDRRGFALIRRRSIAQQRLIWQFCQRYPGPARRLIRWINVRQLPEGYPVDEHFRPPYDPWDQRLCIAPDGDLFRVIREGTASVVTDRIEHVTEDGIALASGEVLPADVVVTATGLQVLPMGGVEIVVDGEPVELSDTVAYKGMMLSGVPNFSFAIGYTNASWTLKVGLLCEHVSRLLAHMDTHGYDVCRPVLAPGESGTRPFLDFGAGYIRRTVDQLPRQGDAAPWSTSMNYHGDVRLLRTGRVDDPHLHFSRVPTAVRPGRSGGSGPAGEATGDPDGRRPAGAEDEDRFVPLLGGLRLCYRVSGPADGVPLLLVAGLGQDLTSWPERLVSSLTGRGFRVVRFDNRDVGRSSTIDAPPPGRLQQLLARPRPGAYTLADLAADTVQLLDHLDVPAAHVVGMSMGGMIAQVLAARHPDRVATLTSIFSTTGHARVGQPARSTLLRLAQPAARDLEQHVARHLAMLRHIGSPTLAFDEPLERAAAAEAWRRSDGSDRAARVARQIGAIQASGDRTPELRRVTAPTLVIHGDTDPMVHPSGGHATAQAIPGARHVELDGMAHHIAPDVLDRLVDLVVEHTGRAANQTATPPVDAERVGGTA